MTRCHTERSYLLSCTDKVSVFLFLSSPFLVLTLSSSHCPPLSFFNDRLLGAAPISVLPHNSVDMEHAVYRQRSQGGPEEEYPEVFWDTSPGYVSHPSESLGS